MRRTAGACHPPLNARGIEFPPGRSCSVTAQRRQVTCALSSQASSHNATLQPSLSGLTLTALNEGCSWQEPPSGRKVVSAQPAPPGGGEASPWIVGSDRPARRARKRSFEL